MSVVEVLRGDVVEARHTVHVAVADAHGRVVARAGNGNGLTYYRSAAKPFQALPLVEEGIVRRFGISLPELALCCASHEGEPEHVATARSILSKIGVDEALIRCGSQLPFGADASQELLMLGGQAMPIHNNCSGKHAGMLALAVGMGWNPVDYHLPGHPVQDRMLREILRWTGLGETEVATGVDGCGVVCFAVPLFQIAKSFARFSVAAADNEGPAEIVRAMTTHPFMVGGTGRACTQVIEAAAGKAFVKLGAEGTYIGGIPASGLGFAIKVEDGGRRAVEVALVKVLEELGVLTEAAVTAISHHGNPIVYNTRGEAVGEIRPAFHLEF
ncbi:MAG TPA: L-asparaginase [Gemmatimonadetes bacterium]|nr:L-asparaginase [Gemmatimonadota bacterium]|tara:strand:+ start:2532 stop:3518 length:987 start_codon:yes stop_codon:yes gene_type:complete